uniref:non-specific serine/threonine protein kinase n=1 Tax=Oryza punctata TaxID=4537 RepID=A0A0E0JTX2_ORYPU
MRQSRLFYLCSIIFMFYLVQRTEAQITAPWEVDALKAIKGSLIDPQGRLNSWNRGDPCMGNWSYVHCYNATASDGYLHVLELQLLKLNLSGSLAAELGRLSHMQIMDFMWNNISGSIPKEVGNITSLKLLLLNGNQLNGSLPEEIGFLPNLDRIQIDQNHISGPIPKSFANLNKTKHLLLDNNNLSGYLPPELSKLPKLLIIQLDNNNFSGTSIPSSYGNITTLLKLSLRNCSLEGPVPDVSGIPQLGYLDLSHNLLNGSIPGSFSGLPNLQRLSLDNNNLDGSVPSDVWQNIDFSGNRSLILDFQNNSLTNLSNPLSPPANVTILLSGNPICTSPNQLNITQYCQSVPVIVPEGSASNATVCSPCSTDLPYENILMSPIRCICAIPLYVDYRLKSPGFWDFVPYEGQFQQYLSSGLSLSSYQLEVSNFMWEEGPRLKMNLKLFPNNTAYFNESEVLRLRGMFTGWLIGDSDIFGPYELLNFNPGWYNNILPDRAKSSLSTGAIVGIVVAAFTAAAFLSSLITLIILRRRSRYSSSKRRSAKRIPMKIDGVKDFSFEELSHGTNDFSDSALIGQGGYGKVYRGILSDGTIVAIKRAQQGSLQGSKEFFTEIELLSRLHHRNLVSLLGYCDEEDEQVVPASIRFYFREQMLVYEFMPNGTLRDHLSARSKEPLNFPMRLRIALGSSRGILYLHTEADPPIFHRDIKASNILLDSKFVAKVADFGLSRLAPEPETEGTAPGHVSTVVKGTPGYLDPEYFLTHKLTDKSDVYSLGVVFLELLTGMQPISHGRNIVREVVAANQCGMILSVVDRRMGSYPAECVERFGALALRCCRDETDARPSMVEVMRELEKIWEMTPETGSMASLSLEPSNTATPSSGSRMVSSSGNDYNMSSSDVSGSNLLSGVVPSINPR